MFSRRNISLAAGMAAAVALTAGALIASTADASPLVAPGQPVPGGHMGGRGIRSATWWCLVAKTLNRKLSIFFRAGVSVSFNTLLRTWPGARLRRRP